MSAFTYVPSPAHCAAFGPGYDRVVVGGIPVAVVGPFLGGYQIRPTDRTGAVVDQTDATPYLRVPASGAERDQAVERWLGLSI